jgi:hypothetical protein
MDRQSRIHGGKLDGTDVIQRVACRAGEITL